jgi:hypothetical protein
MATIQQVQKGFARFIDTDIAGAFEGWQKAVVVGGATLLAANFPNLVKAYGSLPVVAAMGVYNPESGTIDVDKLQSAFLPNLGADKIPITIPKVATIKLGHDEIERLVRYIKEA